MAQKNSEPSCQHEDFRFQTTANVGASAEMVRLTCLACRRSVLMAYDKNNGVNTWNARRELQLQDGIQAQANPQRERVSQPPVPPPPDIWKNIITRHDGGH